MPETTTQTSPFDQIFRDDSGNIVIAQPPNPPLITWLAATGISLLPLNGAAQRGVEALAFGSLFAWAWLELFQGVNYFRRFLGLSVLAILLYSKINAGGIA